MRRIFSDFSKHAPITRFSMDALRFGLFIVLVMKNLRHLYTYVIKFLGKFLLKSCEIQESSFFRRRCQKFLSCLHSIFILRYFSAFLSFFTSWLAKEGLLLPKKTQTEMLLIKTSSYSHIAHFRVGRKIEESGRRKKIKNSSILCYF